MGISAIDAGTTDIAIGNKVYVFGSDRFPNGANYLSFLVQVPVDHVIQDGRVEYTMPRAENGKFSGINHSGIHAAIDNSALKESIRSSECLLLAQGAYCNMSSPATDYKSNYRAELLQRSIRDKRSGAVRHVLLDSSGAAVDLTRKTDLEGRVYVKLTEDPFDRDLDGPIPEEIDWSESWMRVISQVHGDTNVQVVLAYSSENGFILHPSIDSSRFEIVHQNSDYTWVSYRQIGNSLEFLDSFPLSSVITLHRGLLLLSDGGSHPPKVPIRIGYNNRDYAYKYPAFEAGLVPGSVTRNLLRLIASALMNGYPRDEGRELDIQEIFSNADALEESFASIIASSVLGVIDSMDWDSFMNKVLMTAGPSRFSFSDVPSNLDVRGIHIAMNFDITFTQATTGPYTIKDLAIVLLLS